jgi:hypothetical protein
MTSLGWEVSEHLCCKGHISRFWKLGLLKPMMEKQVPEHLCSNGHMSRFGEHTAKLTKDNSE